MVNRALLGSCKTCPYCGAFEFSRIPLNRTVRCESCRCVVEEYCSHDLAEYYVTTHSEELHCVVSPDFLRRYIVDDIPNDPYCTPGFITAFRMLSPQYEPVFGAPARTMSGALSEMERLIGDALYSGYVGYNGRAPGVHVRKEEDGVFKENHDRRREGGDARHILVAYFEIKELASVLDVDWRISNLAVRIFRFTASNTSLRNRSVESLATAAFVAAVQHLCRVHENEGIGSPMSQRSSWYMKLQNLTVRDIAQAANMDESEVHRNIKVVNSALRKQRPDSYESIVAEMPGVCNRLELDDSTRRLAVDIAERTIRLNICSRRAPASVSAACIFMACRLQGVRKTQIEVSRATSVTEVTLRKVHKELTREEAAVIPAWFRESLTSKTLGKTSRSLSISMSPLDSRQGSLHEKSLPPPPLPPGFDRNVQPDTFVPNKNNGNDAANACIEGGSMSSGSVVEENGSSSVSKVEIPDPANPAALQAFASVLASNPAALQAFASAMAMMPQMIPSMMAPLPPPPPPPPPLPPRLPDRSTAQSTARSSDLNASGYEGERKEK